MNKFQILVVEDDVAVRNLITTTLKAHNYRFITATNGEGAVMEAASHNPDIILLDLGLPDLDGVDVIKKIRTWSNTPIIVISSIIDKKHRLDILQTGVEYFIKSPIDVSSFSINLYLVLSSYK